MTLREGGGVGGLKNLANSSFHGGFLTSTKNPLSLKEEITFTTSSIRSRNHADFQYAAPGLAVDSNLPKRIFTMEIIFKGSPL